MSWNGTVHCSYCGGRGHNRLGCPQRRRDAEAYPHIAREIEREQARRSRAVAKRVCSYCGKGGHNRRGCDLLKQDKSLILARQRSYRHNFTKALNDAGLVPGSLIKAYTDTDHSPKGYLALVTEIDWEKVDFLIKDVPIERSWASFRSNLVRVRAVSAFGYDQTDANRSVRYGGTPEFNEEFGIGGPILHNIVPSIYHHTLDATTRSSDPVRSAIVSRSTVNLVCSADSLLTENIITTFHLKPAKNSDHWEKSRISMTLPHWSRVRESEHKKAKEEQSS